jgi:hypothetical protein
MQKFAFKNLGTYTVRVFLAFDIPSANSDDHFSMLNSFRRIHPSRKHGVTIPDRFYCYGKALLASVSDPRLEDSLSSRRLGRRREDDTNMNIREIGSYGPDSFGSG